MKGNMTAKLANIVSRFALPYPIDAEEPESYTLAQRHVPGSIQHEADVIFEAAQGAEPVYVTDADDYEAIP